MKEIKATIVDFSGGGDGITALYLDGVLHTYGDYYHNKIDDTIGGFLDGVKYVLGDDNVIEVSISLHDEHPLIKDTWDNGNPPPDNLSDINEDEGK